MTVHLHSACRMYTLKCDLTRENSIFRHKYAVFQARSEQPNEWPRINYYFADYKCDKLLLTQIHKAFCLFESRLQWFQQLDIPVHCVRSTMWYMMIEMESVRNVKYQITNGIEWFAKQPNIQMHNLNIDCTVPNDACDSSTTNMNLPV